MYTEQSNVITLKLKRINIGAGLGNGAAIIARTNESKLNHTLCQKQS